MDFRPISGDRQILVSGRSGWSGLACGEKGRDEGAGPVTSEPESGSSARTEACIAAQPCERVCARHGNTSCARCVPPCFAGCMSGRTAGAGLVELVSQKVNMWPGFRVDVRVARTRLEHISLRNTFNAAYLRDV